jgi:GNAT superfamily N-acetyltransferase
VNWSEDLETIRPLFREYRKWIADHADPAPSSQARVRSGLAEIDRLIDELPGRYGPPHGDVILWFRDDSLVACGAIRSLEPTVGEIKRIFVRPDYRGPAFGVPFVRTLMDRARELGCRKLRTYALPTMTAAIEFYQELGFQPIASYWSHPASGALFFECDLSG